MKSIKARKLEKYKNSKDIIIIDVRSKDEFKQKSIPNSYNIPSEIIFNNLINYLNKDKIYHIICEDGSRSQFVCKILNQLNYQVVNIKGGICKYRGYIEINESY